MHEKKMRMGPENVREKEWLGIGTPLFEMLSLLQTEMIEIG
jgi:hypothetical protein